MTPNSAPETLKIAHIASGDLWAGAEVQIYYLLKELNRTPDVSVSAILLNHGTLEEKLRQENIQVTVLDESALGPLRILYEIIRLLRSSRPDIVHTHRQKENVLGSIGARLAGIRHCVRTVHGDQEHRLKPWQIAKYSYVLADRLCGRYMQAGLIAVSGELAGRLSKRYPEEKISVIENGIDCDEIKTLSKEDVILPGDPDAAKIAFVGRLVPVKRPDLFLEIAAELVNKSEYPLNFYIFGDGPLHGEVSEEIHEKNLDKHVFLLGFKDNIAAFLARMDLLLLTSDHEGTPMSILEARALSVPVVAHGIGGVPAILSDYNLGCLVRGQEPQEYTSGINTFIRGNKGNSFPGSHGGNTNSLFTYSSYSCMVKHKTLYNAVYQRAT